MQLSSGGSKQQLAGTKYPKYLRHLPGSGVSCSPEQPAPPQNIAAVLSGSPSITSLPQQSAQAESSSSPCKRVPCGEERNGLHCSTVSPQPAVSSNAVPLQCQTALNSMAHAASTPVHTTGKHLTETCHLLAPDSAQPGQVQVSGSSLETPKYMQRLLTGAHAVGFCNAFRQPTQPGLIFFQERTPTHPAASFTSNGSHTTALQSRHIVASKDAALQAAQAQANPAAWSQATSLLALLAGRPLHSSSQTSSPSAQSQLTGKPIQSFSLPSSTPPHPTPATERPVRSLHSASGNVAQPQQPDRALQSLPVPPANAALPQLSQLRKLLWTTEPTVEPDVRSKQSCDFQVPPDSGASMDTLAQLRQLQKERKLPWTTGSVVKPPALQEQGLDNEEEQTHASAPGPGPSFPLQPLQRRPLLWSSGPALPHDQEPCPAPPTVSNSIMPDQATKPQAGCCSPGKRKRSCLINIAEGAPCADTGSRPEASPLIKFRYELTTSLNPCVHLFETTVGLCCMHYIPAPAMSVSHGLVRMTSMHSHACDISGQKSQVTCLFDV